MVRIGLIEKRVAGEEFQLWKLKVNSDHTATLICEDGNGKAIYSKAIEYSDFPCLLRHIAQL